MQKNTEAVLNALINGERYGKHTDSLWTDGQSIFSYLTWIVRISPQGKTWYLNMTNYSPTTTRHQNGIRAQWDRNNFAYITRVGVPQETELHRVQLGLAETGEEDWKHPRAERDDIPGRLFYT